MTPSKHLQVQAEITALLAELGPHTKLPDERSLADKFDVSRDTVRRALRALTSDGRVYAMRGRGTFVAPRRVSRTSRLSSFTEDMAGRDMVPSTRVISMATVDSDADVAAALELPVGGATYRIERLRLADSFPMCFETTWLPESRFPGLVETDLTGSLYALLTAKFAVTIRHADEKVRADAADDRIARLLDVRPGSAALCITRRAFDHYGRAAEYTVSTYRADRYEIDFAVSK